jgi:hypothetical protein
MTTYYHGGTAGLTLADLQIIRAGQKQAKPGRVYGGFYITAREDHAQGYAAMSEAPTLYRVTLHEGTDVSHINEITRISRETIAYCLSAGVKVVKGKDPRGREELAVLDLSAIKSIEVVA